LLVQPALLRQAILFFCHVRSREKQCEAFAWMPRSRLNSLDALLSSIYHTKKGNQNTSQHQQQTIQYGPPEEVRSIFVVVVLLDGCVSDAMVREKSLNALSRRDEEDQRARSRRGRTTDERGLKNQSFDTAMKRIHTGCEDLA
jgi:hypothetical protein